jgi:hypothetical protein
MVLDLLTRPEIITLIAAWIGLIISFYTIQEFNLRKWKIAAYYILTGLTAFILYAFVEAFRIALDTQTAAFFHFVGISFKALAILFITFGVYQVRQTAKTIGA